MSDHLYAVKRQLLGSMFFPKKRRLVLAIERAGFGMADFRLDG